MTRISVLINSLISFLVYTPFEKYVNPSITLFSLSVLSCQRYKGIKIGITFVTIEEEDINLNKKKHADDLPTPISPNSVK